ncbi:MAG: SPFH domain-containing protein [Spirochaetes bacterium]|nr:SPFH domain-containing protein [Spirochaetota bacterium]
MPAFSSSLFFLVLLGIIILTRSIRIAREYERAVVFRLGRLYRAKGPGLFLLLPFIDSMVKVDLRTFTLDVPPQDIITRDNVPVKVNAVVYFRVMNAPDSIVKVENYITATSQLAQTTLRDVVGQSELDDLLSNREKIGKDLQKIIDEKTDPWGVKVSLVEMKDVEIPPNMQRAMAKQAEAERERRAKIIHAEGEFQASEKLAKAAKILSQYDTAIQLRYLQTLTEISSEKTNTILFPVPVDTITKFVQGIKKKG